MSCSQHGCKQKIFKTKKEGEKKSRFLCNLSHAHFISPYTSRGRSQRKFPISGQSDWSNQYFSSLAEDGLLGYLSCAPREVPLLVFKKNWEKKPQIKSQISSLLRMSWPRVEEEKRKKSSEEKAEDQRRLEKNWSKCDGYFGSGKLQIGTIMLTPPPPWNIFGWQNPLIDSLWWWMLPLRVDPGNFPPFSLNPSFFPPLSSARQQFIYIIVYAGSLLPPRRTHYDFSCWCFPSSLFLAGFSPPRYETQSSSASPPRLRSANTPFLGFFRSISFSCIHIHIYMSPTRFSPHWRLIGFRDAFSPRIARTGFGHSFVPRRFPERLSWVAESLLLSVISFCFWRSVRTNKMAACCSYSSDTGGGFEVQQH